MRQSLTQGVQVLQPRVEGAPAGHSLCPGLPAHSPLPLLSSLKPLLLGSSLAPLLYKPHPYFRCQLGSLSLSPSFRTPPWPPSTLRKALEGQNVPRPGCGSCLGFPPLCSQREEGHRAGGAGPGAVTRLESGGTGWGPSGGLISRQRWCLNAQA